MLNHAVTLIETQLAEGFKQTLRKGFPAQGYLDFNQVKEELVHTDYNETYVLCGSTPLYFLKFFIDLSFIVLFYCFRHTR